MSSNPFATRFIRPGALPFLFLDGDSAEAIVERLKGQKWWGQIIGEHGSGKSTLLATLLPMLEAAGRRVVAFKIGPGERGVPSIERSSLSAASLIVVDGYEQLSWWSKWKLRMIIRRADAGLLVTAHADVGLGTVFQTKPSEAVARAVVEQLTVDAKSRVEGEQISAAYRETGGNVREMLFRLFDVVQKNATKAAD